MEIDDLRQRLDCRLVAEHYGVHFKRKQGQWWTTHCINQDAHAHGDRNPSFSVGHQGYKCFSANCSISGDVFDLIAWFEEIDPKQNFTQILEIASEHAGILPQYQPTPTHHQSNQPVDPELERYLAPQEPLFSLAPTHPRLRIMKQLWEILKDAPLSDDAHVWLKSRGISAEVAHAYGCRDWASKKDDILNLMASWSDDDLCVAGLATWQDDKLKLWAGLRALSGEAWARGLALPMFYEESPQVPLAWRWRLFEPLTFEQGGTLKAMAQYSGEPTLPMVPLGLKPIENQEITRLSSRPNPVFDDSPYVVIIAEGEPDFLSIAEIGVQLDRDIRVVPLGIVAVSQRFPVQYIDLLLHAQRVIVMLDQGRMIKQYGLHGGEDRAYQIAAMLLRARQKSSNSFEEAFEYIESHFQIALQRDEMDVNDLHQQNKLKGLIEHLLDHPPEKAPLFARRALWKAALEGKGSDLQKQEAQLKSQLKRDKKALLDQLGVIDTKLQHFEPVRGWQAAFQPLSALGWLEREAPARRVLLSHKGECVLPLGKVGFFVGEGGIGKSWALTQLAVSVTTGTPWLQTFQVPETSIGSVVLIMAEEDAEEMHRRLRNIVQHLNLAAHHQSDLSQRLWPMPMAGQFVEFLTEGETSQHFDQFKSLLLAHAPPEGWSLIVLDPASRFMGADAEKDNALATRFVQLLEQLTSLPGQPTVLCVHHTTKMSRTGQGGAGRAGALRGASALTDGARWQGNLFADEDEQGDVLEDRAVFSVTKSNYGPKPPAVYLKRKAHSGVLIPYDNEWMPGAFSSAFEE